MSIQWPWVGSESGLIQRSANDRWKNRWRSWVLVSTIAGAVIHLVVFIVIPAWEITRQPAPDPLQFVQFDPLVASAGSSIDTGNEAVAAAPALDQLEIEVAEGGQGAGDDDDVDARLTTLMEIFGTPSPIVLAPTGDPRQPRELRPPAPPLELDEVTPLAPRLATVGPPVQLPVLRNPTVLQRYLRRRYNPIYREPDGNGYVNVAMWINERGAVEWTAISESSGYALVDEIALDLFNEIALFTPARSEGVRVPVSVVISVPFTARW